MEKKREIDMAYAAGLLDGDGSFSIGKLPNGKSNPLYFPVVQFAKWIKELPEFLHSMFGGNLIIRKAKLKDNGNLGKEGLQWKIRSAANVEPLLKTVIPYLRIKKERAQFLLSFIQSNPFVRGLRMDIETVRIREKAYLQMIAMNSNHLCSSSLDAKSASSFTEDDMEWSYIAGIMDTDGSFAIKKQVHNKGTQVKNPRYLPVISLSMTSLEAINVIRRNCPVGRVYIPNNKCTKSGFHYQFGIYTRDEAIPFLKKLIPYLRGKRKNAEELLNFCENMKVTRVAKLGIPEDELAFRESCHQKLLGLNNNKRGL